MRNAGLKQFTSTDTAIEFKKVSRLGKAIDLKDYDLFLDLLLKKKVKEEDLLTERNRVKETMAKANLPRATSAKTDAVVSRLTDHTKYTGSHKLRFDQETGKGRGRDGRE